MSKGGRWAGGLALLAVGLGTGVALAGEGDDGPRVERHVVVYREPGRFAGWPANHGMWAWGDEILVGFSRGTYKDLGSYHHIDRERPEEHLLARSLDGGLTWAVEEPEPLAALAGAAGMRHGTRPPDAPEHRPIPLDEPIDFTHPDLALTLRMEDKDGGASWFSYSYDRGRSWRGPFRLPMLGQPGVMARTDYLVEGPRDCLAMLTASKSDGREGRPFAARTSDGGLSWEFLSYIGPEPEDGYAIMPSTVRTGPTDLVTTIRLRDSERAWIDSYASHDNGRSWEFLSTPEPDGGTGNPPSLVRLPDGRLALVYGLRREPFGIVARLSGDGGRTWSEAITLRDDGGGTDIGYVRSVVRPDGTVLSVYYYHDRSGPDRYLAATIWNPGTP
ncbi:exo-alpha-sialidase [Tautonia sociabilis]|uniref:exo-alpha-sialidase n=1 Tax=Tautonia sociabilis TaxID=2080755 RepID=UPI001315640D|nr:exo-alpha-sialidase [Tautonia sociabilis]